jgi:ketosteroid isomerase-like protein
VSEENVELVRRWYATLPDLSDPDVSAALEESFRDYFEEGFVLHLPADYPEEPRVFKSREGLERWLSWLGEAQAEWRFVPERLIDAGDQVIVFVMIVGETRNGLPVESPSAHVVTIRSGRIASIHVYRDRREALKAAGVSE